MDGNVPWLCGGDFNLMLMSSEKKGRSNFKIHGAIILRRATGVCDLEDLGYAWHDFTWSNGRGGDKNLQERLDRFLANGAWKGLFSGSFVTHLP
ncbi:Carboxylic acid reductase [Bienertia sinuspersici]